MYKYNYYNELYHHGIKGMKWGVRRYQNADGSLTSSGKKHFSESEVKENKGLTNKQKKALKVGATVVATAAVIAGTAYVTKKMNTRLTSDLTKKYSELGSKYVNESITIKKFASESMNQADIYRRSLSDSNMRKVVTESWKNTSKQYSQKADKMFNEGMDYLSKAKNGQYSIKEKVDMAKELYKRKRN